MGRLAARAANPRPFSSSQPSLHLRLEDGSRLAAARDTARPSVMIRRHRVRAVTLADLVDWHTLTPVMADFLSAAVKARRSIVVSGGQGDGKTTLVRALCAEIPRMEIVGTFESERELFLPEIEGQHAVVFDWEMRAGSGERAEDGSLAGHRTTGSQVTSSFRFRADRQIVGEVLGLQLGINAGSGKGGGGLRAADAIDIGECDCHALLARQIDPDEACHARTFQVVESSSRPAKVSGVTRPLIIEMWAPAFVRGWSPGTASRCCDHVRGVFSCGFRPGD